jgi:hypothetical protein
MSHGDKQILATLTGERFQPVRLHYRVLNQQGLLRAFNNLRCLDHDPSKQCWVWLYEHEARKLEFQQSYAQIPKQLRPIVIGSFHLRDPNRLLLDLLSCERALAAIPFFDKHIPRSATRVTEADIVNRLFAADEMGDPTPESFFDQQPSTFTDPDAEVRRIKEMVAPIRDPEEKLRVALEDMETRAKRPLPPIERFPIYYYEERLDGFFAALKMRQIVALQHWLGNTEYSLHDVIQLMQKPM